MLSIILSTFILSPITPVENTRISFVLQEVISDIFLQYVITSLIPSCPVPALAFPEFIIKYFIF